MDLIKGKVFKKNGKYWVTSLAIGLDFDKDHSNVLKKIQSLECSEEFTQVNFNVSEYTDSTGRKLPMYEMTRDGFTFLAMGFTGEKAAKFKEAYISLFNEYESSFIDYKGWALELKDLTSSLVNNSNKHSENITDLQETVYGDHEQRLVQLEEKGRSNFNSKTQKLCMKVISKFYGGLCPVSGVVILQGLNRIDMNFHHVDGNKSNNSWSNCMPIHKNCHPKTPVELKKVKDWYFPKFLLHMEEIREDKQLSLF